MTSYATLDEWLSHIEALHAKPIDMGLERMREMVRRMDIRFSCPVVTVAGTNGKGSTCAMLESIYGAAGYRTGMHTSPHLLRFNERARIFGREATDDELSEVFEEVERARGDMTLSYFEFTALGILKLFQRANLDVVILEVGLGGRLDAVNVIDPTAAIITTIGIDHTAFLGTTREAIGLEKAHIYRPGIPSLCADADVPATVAEHAEAIGADFRRVGRDFAVEVREDGTFDFRGRTLTFDALPKPALEGENQYRNAAGVLGIVDALVGKLPVAGRAVEEGLSNVRITARFEHVTDTPCRTILDVGHNPQAAEVLRRNIELTRRPDETTLAVFGMLHDKDMRQVAAILRTSFDAWFVASLTGPRAASAGELSAAMREAGVESERIRTYENVAEALAAARHEALQIGARGANRTVRIIVFGSFVTVTAALEVLGREGVRR